MTPQEIGDILKTQFPDAVAAVTPDGHHPCVTIAAERWHDVALFLRDDPRLRLNMLRCISGLDLHPEPKIELVYELIAMQPGGEHGLWKADSTLAVRVAVPRDGGRVASVADVWPAADLHERETYDLVGVTFDNHPDPRRILCPDDWVGHPLRKDYVFPTEYEGIPVAGNELRIASSE